MIKAPVKCPNCENTTIHWIKEDDIVYTKIDDLHKMASSFHLQCEICNCEFILKQTGERNILN